MGEEDFSVTEKSSNGLTQTQKPGREGDWRHEEWQNTSFDALRTSPENLLQPLRQL